MADEKIEINYERIAEGVALDIIKSEVFKKFCTDYACHLEDVLRDEIDERYRSEMEKKFNFANDEDGEMEFGITLEGSLITAFWKSFVTDYLGRKW